MMDPIAARAQPRRGDSRPRALRAAALGLACALALTVTGCETTHRDTSPKPDAVLSVAYPVRAWEVLEAGVTRGYLVRFREAGSERGYYMVRNPAQQDLGMVDLLGRAWRYRAHEETEWLGSGTVLGGARRILGLESGVGDLREVALDRLDDRASQGLDPALSSD